MFLHLQPSPLLPPRLIEEVIGIVTTKILPIVTTVMTFRHYLEITDSYLGKGISDLHLRIEAEEESPPPPTLTDTRLEPAASEVIGGAFIMMTAKKLI